MGEKLTRTMKTNEPSPAFTAAIGTAALTLAVGLLGTFFFGEGLVNTAITCVGLGAVALTQFGTKPYPLSAETVQENPDKIRIVMETLPYEDPKDLK